MKKRLLLLGLIVNLTVSAVAVIDDMKFSRLDTRDGLSNSQIISIFRDSKGFRRLPFQDVLFRCQGHYHTSQ